MILKVSAIEKENHLEQLAKQLNLTVKKNKFSFKSSFGYLDASYYNFNNIELYLYDFKANFEGVFIAENDKNKGKYICSFNLSETPLNKHILDNDETNFQIKGNDLLFYSPEISTNFKIEPEINYKTVVIVFDLKTIEPFILNKKNDFSDKSFFIYRNISPALSSKLKQFFEVKTENISDLLKLNSSVLEIVSVCFDSLYSEPNINSQNIENVDIEAAFNIKNILEKSLMSTCPKISELSIKANMSPTKLKVVFKQIFGESIHQYYIKHKMYKARDLLIKDKYSVSETGYKLGYVNTSHFISLFKKHFETTPKDYILKNI